MNKSVSQLIAYLKDKNERSYRDIERAIGLRQPEVSIAMRFLRERGWITERKTGKDAKARASKIYALRQTLDEIIIYYEEKEKTDYARSSKAISRLKEMISS
jgi:predicted transcriptional regulator